MLVACELQGFPLHVWPVLKYKLAQESRPLAYSTLFFVLN